jgi:F0F1-type ATP synthase assembly protein I
VKDSDKEAQIEQFAQYMMISVSLAVFIGFALGWLAHCMAGLAA